MNVPGDERPHRLDDVHNEQGGPEDSAKPHGDAHLIFHRECEVYRHENTSNGLPDVVCGCRPRISRRRHEDGVVGRPQHSLGDRAKEQPANPRRATRAHYDEMSGVRVGHAQYLDVWLTGGDTEIRLEAVTLAAEGVVEEALSLRHCIRVEAARTANHVGRL